MLDGTKYQYFSRVVCAYAQIFQKRPGCALIGACALIRTNTVCCYDVVIFVHILFLLLTLFCFWIYQNSMRFDGGFFIFVSFL